MIVYLPLTRDSFNTYPDNLEVSVTDNGDLLLTMQNTDRTIGVNLRSLIRAIGALAPEVLDEV